MDAFLAQPPVQSGLIPFAVVLLLGAVLLRLPVRWQGLALVAGFLAAVALIVGTSLTPLTSTRKIILASAVIPLLALLPGSLPARRPVCLGLGAITVAALLWVLWPVLMRQDATDALIQGGGLALYVLVVVAAFVRLGNQCARFAAAAVTTSLATGTTAVLAASALYGQLLFALAAASGALALLRLFAPGVERHRACFGLSAAMAVAVPLALLGAAASVYAKLPPLALPLLAAVPLLALVPLAGQRPAWQRAVASAGLSLLPAAGAIYLAWSAVADSGYSGY